MIGTRYGLQELGVQTTVENFEVIQKNEVVYIAVKPNIVNKVSLADPEFHQGGGGEPEIVRQKHRTLVFWKKPFKTPYQIFKKKYFGINKSHFWRRKQLWGSKKEQWREDVPEPLEKIQNS